MALVEKRNISVILLSQTLLAGQGTVEWAGERIITQQPANSILSLHYSEELTRIYVDWLNDSILILLYDLLFPRAEMK